MRPQVRGACRGSGRLLGKQLDSLVTLIEALVTLIEALVTLIEALVALIAPFVEAPGVRLVVVSSES